MKLKVGARVMIVFNVSIPDSLVNGAIGQVIDIISSNDSKEVNAIIVQLDNPEAGQDQKLQFMAISDKYSMQNGVPIFRSRLEYLPHGRSSKAHGIR